MSDIPTPPAVPSAAPPRTARRGAGPLKQALLALASLRLTVVLFALSLVLVFCGTLAQRDAGIWTVVNQYFRSFFVWIPIQIFFPRTVHIPTAVGFPYPGGWLIGALLLVNLLAAHLTRFKISWKRSGILLIHAGRLPWLALLIPARDIVALVGTPIVMGRGYEFQDARTYAAWGVDYLKYDWCNHSTQNSQASYSIMRDALAKSGRPIVFSLCEWGSTQPWL